MGKTNKAPSFMGDFCSKRIYLLIKSRFSIYSKSGFSISYNIIELGTLPIIFTKTSLNLNNPVKCMKLPSSHR